MSQTAWKYYKDFLGWNIEKQNQALFEKSPTFWEEIGAKKSLEVFHAAAEQVPAYKDFLRKRGIDHQTIKTIDDFKNVPPVDKKNYLRQYPLHKLCWDGDLKRMNVVSVSSGATGDPFFWPRDLWQEQEVDHWYGLTYKYLFNCRKNRTLVVIAFSMGMYIAGPFTFTSTLRFAQKGYSLTVVTPSLDVAAVLRVIENLSSEYDQIIIGGYPPFIKDILDAGVRGGINWKKLRIKLFFGGESFTEVWRSYIHKIIGAKNTDTATVNMYGTADAAILGIETPISIAFRQNIANNQLKLMATFGRETLPSILAYNPLLKYFEVIDEGSLIFTSSSGIPLIRYRIGDVGGVIPFNQSVETLDSDKIRPLWNLPLVYLFGRDDFTIHFYALNIYPENIKEALEHQNIRALVTGKFIASAEYSKDMTQYLDIKIELAQGIKSDQSGERLIKKTLIDVLRKKNSEYDTLCRMIKERALPQVSLVPWGQEDFRINIKHRWVKKNNLDH